MEYSNLKYLTSGDSNTSLKRKIFYVCHPNDFHYLNEVYRDLSEACKSTVFYYEPGREPISREQLETDLCSMNLFIAVITSEFLFKPSFARDTALEFALKNTIPVLPVLYESGLEEAFNEKIGNLQCLNKYQEKIDSTTVPYNEKLKNYLSQVLSAEIDIKRCYSAFDTSIFLSYRKKDRRYAQKLMELIHEDAECRNIAIWYDEFLIPGEDFNDGIKSKLEESPLFVLVVTPHIVEGDNYITLTEYPMAASLEKEVLPFEMHPTDCEKLKVFCPGINDTIDAESGVNVRRAILNATKRLGIIQKENTQQRKFLIGLAYLKGICVEKNSAIGFSMIAEAAHEGVAEAVEALVSIYKNGEGSDRNLEAAITWQKQLLSLYIDICEKDFVTQNLHAVIKAYLELAEMQTMFRNYPSALIAYEEMIAFCTKQPLKDTVYAKKHTALAYESAAKLQILLGDYTKANHDYLQHALSIRKELHCTEDSLKSKLELIEVYELMGECCENADDTAGVKTQVIYIKNLLSDTDIPDASAKNYDLLKRFMLCHNRLGHLYNVLNMWEEAFVCIGRAVSLAEKLSEISDTPESKRQLILAHINDGDQHARCNVENHYRAALTAYLRARELAEQSLLTKETPETKQDMAKTERKTGYVISRLQSDKDALIHYENALKHLRSAHSLAGTLPIKRELYQCCYEAAKIYQSNGDRNVAMKLLEESVALNTEALRLSELSVLRTELAKTLISLGEWYKADWEVDTALEYFQKAHVYLKKAWSATGRIRELKDYVASFREHIAVAKLAGNFEEVNDLTLELKLLYNEYNMFLN